MNEQEHSRVPRGGKQKLTVGGIVVALLALVLANPMIRAKLGWSEQTQQSSTAGDNPAVSDRTHTSSKPNGNTRTQRAQETDDQPTGPSNRTQAPSAQTGREASALTVKQAYDSGSSDVQMEVIGRVRKVLPDDNDGDRHQRFILLLSDGNTVLIAHNIDLAKRVPVNEGDEVVVFGEYEWSEQGGTMHWTHHDPKGWHVDGWIKHNGKVYK